MNTDAQCAPTPTTFDVSGEAAEWLQRADAHFTAGDLPAAREALRRLVSLAPDTASFLVTLANVEFLLGEIVAAERNFDRAAILDPGNPDLLTCLAIARYRLGRHADAERTFALVFESDPNNARALRHLADLHREAGEFLKARPFYDRLSKIYPEDLAVLLARGF